MARGDDREEQAPFNNPFAEHVSKLKRRVRDAEARHSTPDREASSSAETSPPGNSFGDAVRDAVPLTKGVRRIPAGTKPLAAQVVDPPASFAEALAAEPFDLGFSDAFIRGRAAGVSRQTLGRLERGEFAVRAHVDLHGMVLQDAKERVDAFLAECHRQRLRCVLVITGKGRNSPDHVGVLRDQIPKWLVRGPSARLLLAFVTARACDGGVGALYVLLRKHSSRKNRIDVESGAGG